MRDERIEAYARLLVERSVDVQPGWQVLVQSSPLARPLIEEIVRVIARRGAYPLVRMNYDSTALAWLEAASDDLLSVLAPADAHMYETLDASIHIEEFLIQTLDTDDGARVLGELGIGCNPGIQHHMRNVLFDEKIYGTIHLAVGAGFPFIGGTNVSHIHWDMVKDLRAGGQIYCDGELVQQNGEWLI